MGPVSILSEITSVLVPMGLKEKIVKSTLMNAKYLLAKIMQLVLMKSTTTLVSASQDLQEKIAKMKLMSVTVRLVNTARGVKTELMIIPFQQVNIVLYLKGF